MSVPMHEVIGILDSTADVIIEDLGITITDSTNGHDLSTQFTYPQLAESDDLRQSVEDAIVIINDGSSNLSAADGVKYLTIIQQDYLEDNYYDMTELGTSGQSNIHWDNVTNVPDFGSLEWREPVEARVVDIAASAPGSPSDGDIYANTTDDNYYIHDGTNWSVLAAVIEGERVINLSNADEDIYEFTSGSWVELPKQPDNASVIVQNDGDSKQAQYVYSPTDSQWYKISDVDYAAHFDGGPHQHDGSEIDIENSYLNIGNNAGDDLETVISDINDALLSTNPSLDSAYDQGGAGIGRTITVDSQAVKLDATTGTDAPLELTPLSSLPTTNLSGGQLAIKDGILYCYCDTRSKWLSVDRKFLIFGRQGVTKVQYLPFSAGNMPSNNSGLRMVRNATIVSLSAQLDSSGTGTFNILKNDAAGVVTSLAISAATNAGDTTINVDLTVADFLQCKMSSDAGVEDPLLIVEIAFRP